MKGGRGRWVPLTPRLVRAFRDHAAQFRFSGSPWVFHHVTTRARYAKGARLASLRRGFATAATRAKLPAGLRMHDLRHRCCTDLLARGADVVKVQAMMGHSDVRTTMRYLHLSREHLRGLPGMVERPAGAALAREA